MGLGRSYAIKTNIGCDKIFIIMHVELYRTVHPRYGIGNNCILNYTWVMMREYVIILVLK